MPETEAEAKSSAIFLDAMTIMVSILLFNFIIEGNSMKVACAGYLFINGLSIMGGYSIGNMGEEGQKYNNKYHKWAVVFMNTTAGIAVVWSLYADQSPLLVLYGALIVVGLFSLGYIATFVAGYIRPHSFLARFRSVLARELIATIMAGKIHPWGYLIGMVLSVPIAYIAWKHLKQQQSKNGWDFR